MPGSLIDGLESHDVDGDGDLDLVVFRNRELWFFDNRGGGNFELVAERVIDRSLDNFGVADFDGDGSPDVAVEVASPQRAQSLGAHKRRALERSH